MADEARDVSSSDTRRDRRRELARSPREQRRIRVALGVIGFGVLVIVGLFLAFYIVTFVLPPRRLVVRVDDVTYSRSDMLKILQSKRKQAEIFGTEFRSGTEVFNVLQTIVEDEIIAQSAPKLGITVLKDEIDRAVIAMFTPLEDLLESDGIQSDGQKSREFRESYNAFLNEVQISDREFKQQLGRDLLRSKFRQYIGERIANVAPQVHLYRVAMMASDEIEIMQEKYEDALERSTDPEDIKQVVKAIAREFSRDDPETVRMGGDLGWIPQGILKDYEDQFFDLDVGEMSEPVSSLDNPRQVIFFIVSERNESRRLDEDDKAVLKTNAVQVWVNEARDQHEVYAKFETSIYDWFLKQLKLTAVETPTPALGVPGLSTGG